jgi:hypothetical protein
MIIGQREITGGNLRALVEEALLGFMNDDLSDERVN